MNYAFGLEVLPKDFRFWLKEVSDYCAFALRSKQLNEAMRERVLSLANYWMMSVADASEEQTPFRAPLWSLPSTLNLGKVDIYALGIFTPRSLIAQLAPTSPLLYIFSLACHLSLAPEAERDTLLAALLTHESDLDPLWPALARHIARISTAEDRSLLEELAQHPERREPPLSWGLRHIIRGDIILDDGDTLTLDEVTEQMGMPRLSHLENISPEEKAV
jgi:hypothetical protein